VAFSQPGRDTILVDDASEIPRQQRGLGVKGFGAPIQIGHFNFLTYVVDENIPAQTASAMSEWYAERIVTADFQPLSKEDEADFRVTFAGRLRPDQIDQLVKWHREEITPKLLKARQQQ
jgi:isopentenyl diphosphate isomerase/L-lactate dehydrogenase-like FMN-dependent dehydrogenase